MLVCLFMWWTISPAVSSKMDLSCKEEEKNQYWVESQVLRENDLAHGTTATYMTSNKDNHTKWRRFCSGMRWVAELTGTGSECMLIVNNAPNWLVRTRAHKKLRVIPVKWLPCKCGTKLDFVPKWNSYRYHVNTPLLSLMCPDSHLICKDYMRSTGVTTSLGSLLLSLIIHALYFVNQTLGSHGLEVILFKGDSLMV